MATTIKDSVYKAIDVIVGKRIEDLHLDKTIEAIVESCIDIASRKYRLRYGSGVFDAYAADDNVYMPNTAVYVLIPENDFNKKKTIIGRANTGTQTNTEEEQSIASMYNGYSIIGTNLLVPTNNSSNIYGLQSYNPEYSSILLYDADQPQEKNKLNIDNEKLKIYLEESKGFIFSGKFKTNFVNALSGKEDYGLVFKLSLKNGKTSFATMEDRWKVQEPKTSCFINSEEWSLNNYRNNIEEYFEIALEQLRSSPMSEQKIVQSLQDNLAKEQVKIRSFIAELTSFIDTESLELANLYVQLINDLINYTINEKNENVTLQDLQYQYDNWFTGSSYAFQEQEYAVELNTSYMTGNVFHYPSATYQYRFVEIDPDIFVRINSIYFYSKNFTKNLELASHSNDIQVQDVAITCIKYLGNVNGDYCLNLEYDDIYFDSSANNKDTLTITAKMTYKNNTDITDYSTIMWFKKNNSITANSQYYSMYAGAGWEHITSMSKIGVQDKSNTLTLKAEDNLTYRNIYKVVGMYESGTIVQQEFTIYNNKHKHNIDLISDSGSNFGAGSGKKRITCTIDGSTTIDFNQYSFIWYIKTFEGNYYKILNENDIQELENSINNSDFSATEKIDKKTELNTLQNIQWYDGNYIIVNSAAVPNNSNVQIVCVVKANDIELDELSLTLTSGYSVHLKNYYIEIINGNQVFQYNEAGISPASNIYEDPQEILPLSCNFYDPAGGIINPLNYNISWEVPITNTLIQVDNNALMYNVISDSNNLLQGDTCPFSINNEYNYNATNNQIICIIEFDDGDGLVSYRQSTDFFFGKIGDDGTNGTDVVNKITVVYNDHADLSSHYNNNTLLDELLTLKVEPSDDINQSNIFWNNGLSINDPVLQLDLFRKNNLINNKEYRKVNWSILNNGLTSKYWRTQNTEEESSGNKQVILMYDIEKNDNDKSYTNYIIKAQADLPIDEEKYQTYYNFYPICVDTKYNVDTQSYVNDITNTTQTVKNDYVVGIDRARTLRQVVYNSDGRNPLYDKNLGVGLSFENLDYPRTIVWEPHGGIILNNKKGEVFPAFSIGKEISYVTGQNNVISDTVDRLEQLRDDEIEERELSQYNNAIAIVQDNINNVIDDLTIQKNIINSELNTLYNERTDSWNIFVKQRKDAISEMYTKLYNQIDDILWSTNPEWVMEDFLFIADPAARRYYENQTNTFKEDISNYLEYYTNFLDNPNYTGDTTNYQIEANNLEEILTKLFININISNIDDKKAIELSFSTLKNLLIIGYNTYKILYNKKNQELDDNINNLEISAQEINDNLIKYISVLNNVNNNTDNVQEVIKNILFDRSGDNYLDSTLLLDIVNMTKEQFEEDILFITNKYNMQIAFLTGILTDDIDPTFCSVLPNEVYTGEFPNQYVKVKIYQGILDEINDNSILEHELIIPFHMSLNTYGLASLNAWDGSSVEINEDEGYVLAPQIGAGIKHVEDNTFTGVLMGTEKTYDDEERQEEIGLLGYSHGKRSIFLDASTGNATFGLLEEDAADISNPLTEGRIELRPGGTSSISKWNFDSRSLYRVASDDETEAILQARAYTEQFSANSLGAPYEDAPQYAHGSIPHTKQGILLSALPAYASFKGRILTEKDHTDERVNYLNLNTSVREGDTFELQIDPNDSRFFSLYEHSTRIYEGYGTCDTWNGYKEEDKYPMTAAEFNQYFKILATNTEIDKENTIILTQRYLKTNNDGELRQVFRPLSYLYKENNIYYWKIINATVDKRYRVTTEYVVATLKQYIDWQNDNTKQTTWIYITFAPSDGVKPDKIPLVPEYNNKNKLIGLSLLEDDENVNEDTKVWHRYKKAGIDATGKFVSEGVGTGAVGLGLNDIQAFNLGSLFIGANFESNNGTIIQFFVDKLSTKADAPLFISSTKTLSDPSISDTSRDNEGKRPIRIYAGNNSDTITDSNYLSTGIFVGASHEKDPQNGITKLELRQTSLEDNIIILSALGTNIDSNSSVLTLNSSSDTEQVGSLKHTGSWTTIISKKLDSVVGDSMSFIGKDINATLSNGISATLNDKINRITINKDEIDIRNNKNNILILPDKHNNDIHPSFLSGYYGVRIIGGYNNKPGAVNNSVFIHAQNTSDGLLLVASNGTTRSTSKGDVFFKLIPSTKDTNARFQLQSGNSGYIYSSNKVVTSAGYGIVMGPGLQIKDDGTGFIKCNGQYITSTAYGYNTKNDSKNPDYDYTTSLSLGVGGSSSFYISRIEGFGTAGKGNNSKYGRPTFKTEKIVVQMPSADAVWKAIKTYVDSAISTALSNAKFASSTHTHNIGGLHTYYGYSNLSSNTGDTTVSAFGGKHNHTISHSQGFKAFSTRDTVFKTGGPVG